MARPNVAPCTPAVHPRTARSGCCRSGFVTGDRRASRSTSGRQAFRPVTVRGLCSSRDAAMEEVASPLAAWESFYVILGSSAAALTGLMFVVITLIADAGPRTATPQGIATF